MLQLRVMSSYLLAARQLPPAAEAPPDYDLRPLSAPVLTGVVLRAFTWALEGPAGNVIVPLMLWRSGITQVLHGVTAPEAPAFLPELPTKDLPDEPGCATLEAFDTPGAAVRCALSEKHLDTRRSSHAEAGASGGSGGSSGGGALPTVQDYLEAYRSGAGQEAPGATFERGIARRSLPYASARVLV
mmetsp:Transcript_6710/g.20698  ORF Transcript_6710/g.20698 Transcript_6710/m.20698 type:complete len:186 (-) Transcript_6710:409-966(-)